jgi:hypothetical protein
MARSEAISRDRRSSVQLVQCSSGASEGSVASWRVSCCCENLVVGERGYLVNPEEGERPPLRDVTRQRLVKTQETEKT